jgi:hypothetical protein
MQNQLRMTHDYSMIHKDQKATSPDADQGHQPVYGTCYSGLPQRKMQEM